MNLDQAVDWSRGPTNRNAYVIRHVPAETCFVAATQLLKGPLYPDTCPLAYARNSAIPVARRFGGRMAANRDIAVARGSRLVDASLAG